MTRSAMIGLAVCACLLSSCGQESSNDPTPAPAPVSVELRVRGPLEWNDRYIEMGDMESYKITLPAGQFDEGEQVSFFSYRLRDGEHSGAGGGSFHQGETRKLDVEHQSTFVIATSRVHFAVSEPHTFDLRNGKGIVQPDETLRLKMLPAAFIKLIIPEDSRLTEATYHVERMDGFKLYHDFRAAKEGKGGFRMFEAGKQHRLVREHHPEEVHIIGPFDAGTRNEVVLKPTVFGG